MTNLILEDGSPNRRHRQRLSKLLNECTDTIRIASAYVTERQFLTTYPKHEVRLLTSLRPMDVASGATSIEALNALLQLGVKCRALPSRPRLHSKVYIFGTSSAVVTSANFTGNAFDSNIEAGLETSANEARQLAAWFDRLWEIASPITVDQLLELHNETSALRRDFMKLKQKLRAKARSSQKNNTKTALSDSLVNLFDSATRFFVCNTHRRNGVLTSTGGYHLEEEMHNQGFAVAWEDFKYPSHMKRVELGDAIFMFAKGVGIIGVGVAKAVCETLSSSQAGRLSYDYDSIEWRVPTRWLAWTDADGAFPWRSPNCTFCDVTQSKYDEFRAGVMAHFLGDE
ncbi:MAG: phospholipase D family protein [Nitrospirae bacterium]|nr:phospholipase D family protein [Nitrospirota bacterium]